MSGMMEIAALVAIIVGISQVFKNMGLPTKFIPLLNLILGMGLCLFFLSDLGIKESILQGLIVGLSASGLYDQSKIITSNSNEKAKEKDKE